PVGETGTAGVLALPATIEADPAAVANIAAPVIGRVVALDVRLGQSVRRGQVLARLASGDFAQAQADVLKAQDGLNLAGQTRARAQGVLAVGGASAKDLEAARSGEAQARDELVRARARLAALGGADAGRSPDLLLRAPFDGVVTALSLAPGAQVDDPTATLMTITDLGRVSAVAAAPQDDLAKLSVGDPAEVSVEGQPARALQGRIGEIDAFVAADTRRQKVRVPLANPDRRLLPGMYATVRVPLATPGALTVPQSALQMDNDAVTVLVEVRPWAFQRRPVVLGDETADAAQVLRGLRPGERVVVRGGVLFGD
ncbi:MAG: efflux RND transporter periplasmic adaptor subunit, partial [Caulobacteraceae bacterium]|nr:efflux RND transporter periplasmic adaptor subunit [Caulobacter sp.]